jgi:hydrogenase/urease accessory protein HupE
MNWIARLGCAALVLGGLLASQAARSHEARPAYLEVTETSAGRYDVLWRTPMLAGQRLPVRLVFPDNVRNIISPGERMLVDSVVERRVIDAGPEGLAGRRVEFSGLDFTLSDVLVRVARLDGTHWTALVKPEQPWIEMRERQGMFAVVGAYVLQGLQHILAGFDHLLFVFALMLLVGSGWTLVKTITAFTVAHSITLALATLGVIHVPAPPVEVTIALSILFLAGEIARVSRGQASLSARAPWIVAFCFGLLHGLGFAGALSEIGLPQGDVPLALLSFNVGVELGQLAFVGAVLALRAALTRLPLPANLLRHAQPIAYYVIGTASAFWFFDRLSEFWA